MSQLQFLLSLVNNLLDVKMLEQGVFEPKVESFKPLEVLEFVTDMFREQMYMDGNELSYHVLEAASLRQAYDSNYEMHHLETTTMPETIFGDHMRLRQILVNLVKNASKFTRRGKVRIFVAFDPQSHFLNVHVVDTGKGIKQTEMDHLFNMFGKLKRTASQNAEGIGLGLMISKKLVEGCGGAIEARSQGENKGSSFMFSMLMAKNKKDYEPVYLATKNEIATNEKTSEFVQKTIEKVEKNKTIPQSKFSSGLPTTAEREDHHELSVRKNDSDNLISFREKAGEERFLV